MSLDGFPRVPLMFGPSPVHPLPRLSAALGGRVEIWAKREDCNSGIAFGGNKVRKLEYLVADALAQGCDTLVSIGGVQSNHTRAVTGVARHLGLGVERALRDDEITLVDGYAGPCYGVPDVETIEAIQLAARTEGMITDPVYEGKPMAGLIGMIRSGEIPPGSRVLYAHLGGQPALSAYAHTPGLGG